MYLSLPFTICSEGLSQWNGQEKERKGIYIAKKKVKLNLFEDHDQVCRKIIVFKNTGVDSVNWNSCTNIEETIL